MKWLPDRMQGPMNFAAGWRPWKHCERLHQT